MITDQRVLDAYRTWRRRRTFYEFPDGRRDTSGRWFPSDWERRQCCESVRTPSRRWPWSLQRHCKTLAHCATLYGVSPREVRSLQRKMDRPVTTAPDDLCLRCYVPLCEHIEEQRAENTGRMYPVPVPDDRGDFDRHDARLHGPAVVPSRWRHDPTRLGLDPDWLPPFAEDEGAA